MDTFDTISLKILKFIVHLGLLLVQAFGVWPYRYDQKLKSFQNTNILRCYTALVVPFILFAYVFGIPMIKVDKDIRVHIPSTVGRFTTVFLSILVVLTYLITSVNQIMNYNSINEWFKKAQVVTKKIHCFNKGYGLPFLWPVMQYVVNVLVINGLQIYATLGILLHLISPGTWKYLLMAFFILPNIAIAIIPNIFYGFMLAITYYYRLLNQHLSNIMQNINNNNKSKKCAAVLDNRKYFYMKQSCDLSDEIDQLSILHQEVTVCAVLINRIFSVHLMFFMAYEICVFTSKLFIIYIIFEYELRTLRTSGTSQFSYAILWFNFVIFVLAFWVTSVLSHSCHMTMKEVHIY